MLNAAGEKNTTATVTAEVATKQEEETENGVTAEDIGNAVEDGANEVGDAVGDAAQTVDENVDVDVELGSSASSASSASSFFLAGSSAAVILGVGACVL